MNAGGGEPAAEFGVIVLEAEQQHAAALEHVLPGQRPTGGQREVLQRPQSGLAGGARREQTG
jgi:hypothetical protein